jgi:hypothetical protein
MEESAYLVTRRSLVGLMATAALGAPLSVASADDAMVIVHKDPNCGCCSLWVPHLLDAGFAVRVEEAADLKTVRARLGIPAALAACHTAEVAGYVLEGHVPAVAVRRLLSDRPNAKGLAVPGMPIGSPGMEGGQPQPFTVVLFGPDGSRPFMRFIGKQAVG